MRGPSCTHGYWNLPEVNKKSFHEGWFKTGDVAMIDSEHFFYIVDRKKELIKYKVSSCDPLKSARSSQK